MIAVIVFLALVIVAFWLSVAMFIRLMDLNLQQRRSRDADTRRKP